MVNAQVIHDEMKMLIGHEDFFFIKVHFLFVFRDAAKKCFGACLEWSTNFQQPSAFFCGHLWCQRYLLLICHCVPCISVRKSEVLYFHYVYLWMVLFTNYKVIGGLVFYFWKKRNYFLWMFVESSADFK